MPRYFFHLRDDHDELLDPEGLELEDLEAAKAAALEAARDTLSHDLKEGLLDLRFRIDVEDESGCVVHSLALGDAFEVRTHSGRAAAAQIRLSADNDVA